MTAAARRPKVTPKHARAAARGAANLVKTMNNRNPAATDVARASVVLPGIYAAASDADKWPQALGAVAELLGASCGLIFSHQAAPDQRGMWVGYRISPEARQRYIERYHAHDIWMQRGHALDVWVPGRVVSGRDLVDDRSFLKSEFYREFLAPQDIRDICAGVLHDGSETSLPRVNIAVYRSHSRPLFEDRDKALMSLLLPHLAEAVRIGFRIADLEQRLLISREAADILLPALALTDVAGNVVFANRPLAHLLSDRDGLAIENGRLRTGAARLQSRLDRLLQDDRAADSALKIPRPSGKPALWLIRVDLPSPAGSPADARRPSRAFLIHDPAAPVEANVRDFAAQHGFSPAETRLLSALLAHSTLPEAARHLDVSINTVRSQLRSAMDKCGARRQVELMKMLVSWPRRGGQEK